MPPDSLMLPRQPGLSRAILVVGAVLYLLLCGPAIGCRGYPPLEPFWMAMTFLWPAGILLSAIFDSGAFASRRRDLLVYALATAWVDAATMCTVVPKRLDIVEVSTATLLLFGPAHLVLTALLELAAQAALRPLRSLREAETQDAGLRATPRRLWCLVSVVVVLIVLFPFAFAQCAIEWQYNRGRRQADEDWAQHRVRVYCDDFAERRPRFTITHEYDPLTGLERRRRWPDHGFSQGYNPSGCAPKAFPRGP